MFCFILLLVLFLNTIKNIQDKYMLIYSAIITLCIFIHCFTVYHIQLERMKHFDFDDWRNRYMKWMNHNKSRIMDFFRKQDRDHDGRITRREFIDGILGSSRHR